MSDNTLAHVDLGSFNLPGDGVADAMFTKLAALYNEIVDKVKTHREHDKGDDAVSDLLNSDTLEQDHPELFSRVSKLAELKDAVSKLTDLVNTQAAEIVASGESDGFDLDKSRQDIAAMRKDAQALYQIMVKVLELSGSIVLTRSESGAIEDIESQDAYGDALDALSNIPKVRASRGASSTSANSETPKIRAWAKENGYDVGDKGRIQADIVTAYHEAHSPNADSDSE